MTDQKKSQKPVRSAVRGSTTHRSTVKSSTLQSRWTWAGRTIAIIFALFLGLIIWSIFSNYRTQSATQVVREDFGDTDDFSSVNGFAVFREILNKRGCNIHPTSLLTPQLDDNDVLIWFHNSSTLPQSEAFERVEEWLALGGRQLIFVGNDHNAKPEFLEAVYRSSELKDRQWARVVSRLEMSRELKELHQPYLYQERRTSFLRYYSGQSCDWFSVDDAPHGFVGQWSLESEDTTGSENATDAGQNQLPSIRVRQHLKPRVSDYEVLASCSNGEDSLPLLYRFSPGESDSEIVVASSAAFLTNYGTVQPENRPLIETVLQQIPRNSEVQILESGPLRVPLSSTPEDRMVKTWSWMKHGLFPIAVLHVLAFAVIFCFARFPVFGRPKEVEFRPRNDFGLHLEEVGRLLRNSRRESFAKEKIQHYFDIVKRSLVGRGPSSRM